MQVLPPPSPKSTKEVNLSKHPRFSFHQPRSNEKRRKLQKQIVLKLPESQRPIRVVNWVLGSLTTLIVLCVGVAIYLSSSKFDSSQEAIPQTFSDLMQLTPAQLAKQDIARINLLCATDLHGSENLNVQQCLNILDEVAKQIEEATRKAISRYYQDPYFHKNYSLNQFKIMAMISYVQNKLGWIYNPDLAWPPNEKTKRLLLQKTGESSQNAYVHGLIEPPHKGTCSSFPVLWVSLGRRLGYPLYVVQVNTHGFARWDDGKERFNFEAINGGASFPSDESYLMWPYPLTQEDLATGHYLKNHTIEEDFAYSLACRIQYLWKVRDREGVALSALKIRELVPNDREFMKTVWAARHALTPPTARELNSPPESQRATQQLLAQVMPDPEHRNYLSHNAPRFNEKLDQLESLRDAEMDERTIAIAAQSIPDPQPEPGMSQMPSIDPMDIALKNMNPQVRGYVKAAMQGNFSLAGKPAQDNQPAFVNFPIGQYPMDKTWGRYEE